MCGEGNTWKQRGCGVGEFAKIPGALWWKVVFKRCETVLNTVRKRAQVCSIDGVSKQALGNGLWMVLEENIVYKEAFSPATVLETKD